MQLKLRFTAEASLLFVDIRVKVAMITYSCVVPLAGNTISAARLTHEAVLSSCCRV